MSLLMEDWEADDNISKLLQVNIKNNNGLNQERPALKSLQEELMEVGENLSVVGSSCCANDERKEEISVQAKSIPKGVSASTLGDSNITSCSLFQDTKLNNIVGEFFSLSKMIDGEIVRRQTNAMREQKESVKKQGNVMALQELLFIQHENLLTREENHVRKEREAKKSHELEIKSLQDALLKQKKANDELQQEFNKIIEIKEQEIEDLLTENNDLQSEVASTTKEFEELAWENEELAEKVEIKDDYIESLRFQMSILERQHEQDIWKLEQGDDLLEMVEQERDITVRKYKEKVAKLVQHKPNETMKFGVSATVDQLNAAVEVEGEQASFSEDLPTVASQRQLQQDQCDSAPPAQSSKLPVSSYVRSQSLSVPSCRADEGSHAFIKRRVSIQRRSSRGITKLEEMPVLLKSLGWSSDLISRKN